MFFKPSSLNTWATKTEKPHFSNGTDYSAFFVAVVLYTHATCCMKNSLTVSFVFLIGFLFCVYPSFVTSPGIDCLAGCSIGKGFPFPYHKIYSGGAVGMPSSAVINYNYLLYDVIFLLVIASAVYLLVKRYVQGK